MDNPNTQDIQALVQELQLARNQIQTVSTQINEISLTLESLSKLSTTKGADKKTTVLDVVVAMIFFLGFLHFICHR